MLAWMAFCGEVKTPAMKCSSQSLATDDVTTFDIPKCMMGGRPRQFSVFKFRSWLDVKEVLWIDKMIYLPANFCR